MSTFFPATDHLLCDRTNPVGCPRCGPPPSTLCCDICNAEHFALLFISPAASKPRLANRSHVKPYDTTTRDKDLNAALRVWRRKEAVNVLGALKVRKFGAILFMSDETLQRLVDCAHIGKITTAESVERETHWRRYWVDKTFISLLAIISAHQPSPPTAPVLAALTPGTVSNITASRVSQMRRPNTCSACRTVGHNSTCCPSISH